ncbi:pentapeptide repeat-containing protein [Spirillospora sp. CA-294931]|uniref:pentapeptide repeat-containing protein n=1 Tax=Spirillospora sp. CA-294931 TaxID=3240042 RepID=UPI003D8D0932
MAGPEGDQVGRRALVKRSARKAASPIPPALKVWPLWLYLAAGIVVVAVTALVVWKLWETAGGDPKLQIEAVRIGSTVGFGAGGLYLLILAARRQWLQERMHRYQEHVDARDHVLQERLADQTERDADERRITELFSSAAEHLGSEKAAVRIAALYTLERLANDNPPHQQAIVDIICAYLRMPSRPAQDEDQVRLTAQRLLLAHLHPEAPAHWDLIDVDLAGATLTGFSLAGCRVANSHFRGAKFEGDTDFREATFARTADFGSAHFVGNARFDHASFEDGANFDQAAFSGDAHFAVVSFAQEARFYKANFHRLGFFTGTRFSRGSLFCWATFTGAAVFTDTGFFGRADFSSATFVDDVVFDSPQPENIVLHSAVVADVGLTHVLPAGWRVEPSGGTSGRLAPDGSQPSRS